MESIKTFIFSLNDPIPSRNREAVESPGTRFCERRERAFPAVIGVSARIYAVGRRKAGVDVWGAVVKAIRVGWRAF
jgi:hypothetical protein